MRISLTHFKPLLEPWEDGLFTPQALIERLSKLGHKTERVETPAGGDTVLDLEITSNRGDCLSYYGLARDLSAATGQTLKPLTEPHVSFPIHAGTYPEVPIDVQDASFCPTYYGAVLENIRVGTSPPWLQDFLVQSGVKVINNVVDLTNYILLLTGQPLHAFDFDRIARSRVTVRLSQEGERIKTLDDKDRRLPAGLGVIADSEKLLAVGGIIGGVDSAVTPQTQRVFLECAWFDPVAVRRASKGLALSTESSYRFERIVHPGGQTYFIQVAVSWIQKMIPQAKLVNIYQVGKGSVPSKRVLLRRSWMERLAGFSIPDERIEILLRRLGCVLSPEKSEGWNVEIPSFRPDLVEEVDLGEEILRVYGYDRVPVQTDLRIYSPPVSKSEQWEGICRHFLSSLSFYECATPSFGVVPAPVKSKAGSEEKVADGMFSFSGESKDQPVFLLDREGNPSRSLRSSLIPGLLQVQKINEGYGKRNFSLYELGQVFFFREGTTQEKKRMTLLVTDLDSPWLEGPSVPSPENLFGLTAFFHLKGAVETLLGVGGFSRHRSGIPAQGDSRNPTAWQWISRDFPFYEPGVGLELTLVETNKSPLMRRPLGHLGLLRLEEAQKLGLRQKVVLCELDYELLLERITLGSTYRSFSRYPSVVRDVALLAGADTLWQRIEEAVDVLSIPSLDSFFVYEVYTGEKIPAGKKSFTVRLIFHPLERTLTREEVDQAVEQLLTHLQEKLGISLRK